MAKRGKREFVQVLRLLEVFRLEDVLAGVREAIVFNVPMRIPPKLTFPGLPAGVSPVVSDEAEISFTVKFIPLSIPIHTFGFIADDRL